MSIGPERFVNLPKLFSLNLSNSAFILNYHPNSFVNVPKLKFLKVSRHLDYKYPVPIVPSKVLMSLPGLDKTLKKKLYKNLNASKKRMKDFRKKFRRDYYYFYHNWEYRHDVKLDLCPKKSKYYLDSKIELWRDFFVFGAIWRWGDLSVKMQKIVCEVSGGDVVEQWMEFKQVLIREKIKLSKTELQKFKGSFIDWAASD